MTRRLTTFAILISAAPFASAFTADDYLAEIKPLLLRKCAPCHGALQQNAGLRLDTVNLAIKGGRSGPAITRGNPKRSLLIQRVTATDESARMPQESAALTAKEVELLSRWIAAGSPAPADETPQQDPAQHWSYLPISRPAIPANTDSQNPIDAFLHQSRRANGLAANPPADKATLLRRIHLDLIGLAPTPPELAAFEADESPRAYEAVVDRLLDDPRHGERWGRHWMDVWRYSDWYGRRNVNEIRYSMRHIWRWRDWIVSSVNADKGYDRMIVEMLAGDEVAPTDPDALAATGFIGRNWYKFDRNVWLFETVERTSQAFLGLTLRCARCHDHKYDPVTQKDYYHFRAFFEPHDIRTDRLDARAEYVKDNKKAEILKDGLSRVYDRHLTTNTFLFRRGDDRQPDKSRIMEPRTPVALRGEELRIDPIKLPAEAVYPALRPEIADGLIKLANEKAVRAGAAISKAITKEREALAAVAARKRDGNSGNSPTSQPFLKDDFNKARPDEWKMLNGKWSYQSGQLIQNQVTSFATMVHAKNHPRNFRAKYVYRTLEPGRYRSVGFSFDYLDKGNSQDVYTSTGDARQSVQAFHRFGGKQSYPKPGIVHTPIKLGELTTVTVEARGQRLNIWLNGEHKLDYVMPIARRDGKFAIWVHNGAAEIHSLEIVELRENLEDLQAKARDAKHAIELAVIDEKIAQADVASLKARIAAERSRYSSAAREQFTEHAKAAAAADKGKLALMAEKELLTVTHRVSTMKSSSKDETAIKALEKELAAARQKQIDALVAAKNPGTEYEPVGEKFPETSTGRRLALARWIASPENPRTARVAVNHIWLRHFGRPLVESVPNFGLAGKEPTHPELLDWLAAEFIDSGWSMKRLHRLIVTSEAYRMSSKPLDNPAAQTDPDNRLLWRMNSRRIEAETIRDGVLHASGNLDEQFGGPDLDPKLGQSSNRRSLYFRTTPDEKMQMLDLFDLANPNACYERGTSIVPQQSLALMNGGLALDQARLLAKELSEEVGPNAGSNDAFVNAAFVRILNRNPSKAEAEAMTLFIAARLKSDESIDAFPPGGQSRIPPAKQPLQRARELLAHALFNHNDFVTVR